MRLSWAGFHVVVLEPFEQSKKLMIIIPILQPLYFLHKRMELYRQHNWQYLNLRIRKISELNQY